MESPVLPSSCVTPAGTSIEVQNEWEENTHTHNIITYYYYILLLHIIIDDGAGDGHHMPLLRSSTEPHNKQGL